jgi:hypothetical protein
MRVDADDGLRDPWGQFFSTADHSKALTPYAPMERTGCEGVSMLLPV